ncbi:type IV pilus biogenesis protein PilM [Alteromonas gilva]|uniref:Type IV pilus assembly protein PilM n=1 Tax=Alteromonas gilva TaxID=2987522 RepID=A0ABT5L5H2_9ALTE|nr:type IV pilus assembly protein PilM [Alteromonas gilva]MDC8832123.1 type IV pilus assembly protein PilM [Alteromonas gilva]
MVRSLFKKKQPSIVGLDIGTRCIKAVVLEGAAGDYTLTAYACEPIIKDAFREREISDYDAVSLALRKVRLALKNKLKPAAIAVAGTSVISKVVHMEPDQSDFELEGQIEVEADSLIPYPLEEVYLDFEELGMSETHAGKVNVLLSAAHKDIVDSRSTLVREQSFEPLVVDIESFALGNAVDYFYPHDEARSSVCCINVGASLLQVCVWQEGEVLYTKEHNFGTDTLLQDLALIHMLERKDVESQLIDNTLPDNWVTDTLPVFAANLQQQINRAIQMYMSTMNAKRPQRIVLSGGAAVLPTLTETLQQDLGVEVEVFNPFSTIKISDKLNAEQVQQTAPLMAIAAGLASRGFSPWHI